MEKLRPSRRAFIKNAMGGATTVGLFQTLSRVAYAAPSAEGWIRLFDGESLKGWHTNREKIAHGTGGSWTVEDGTIAGEQDPPDSGNGGILLTNQKFFDFELSIDIKPDWGVCSGLFLRSTELGQCIQMMVDYHDEGNVGQLYGEGTGGFNTRTFDINGMLQDDEELTALSTDKHKQAADVGLISACDPAQYVRAYKLDDWNTARVRVVGRDPHITTWINDLLVCDFDGATTTNEGYSAKRADIVKLVGQEGSIAVQVHGGGGWPVGKKCRWKDIRIRPIR